LKGIFFDATLEIKCKKCGIINKIGHIKIPDQKSNYGLIINKAGNITNVTQTACDVLGYSYDELVGKHFTQINNTLSNEIGQKFFGPDSVLSENNYLRFDTFHLAKNGKLIPITVDLKLYKPNEKDRYVFVLANLKNINKDINDIKDPDSAFVCNACDFHFDIDNKGTLIYLSSSIKGIFNFTDEARIGKSYFDFVPEHKKQEAINTFQFFSVKKQPYRASGQLGFTTKGRILNIELYFTPNFNDYGEFIGYRVLGWLKEKI
jgi:PAS domain S-box-containing protein